jgi:predicted amidophosphoribosyltransferase
MEPIQRSFNDGSFRNRFRKRLDSIVDLFRNLRSTLAPKAQQFGSQRMCPFCGLITPRAKRLCLECGKPLRAIQVERKDAR